MNYLNWSVNSQQFHINSLRLSCRKQGLSAFSPSSLQSVSELAGHDLQPNLNKSSTRLQSITAPPPKVNSIRTSRHNNTNIWGFYWILSSRMTKTFRDNCDINIVQQISCEAPCPDVQMQVKTLIHSFCTPMYASQLWCNFRFVQAEIVCGI